jgi:hypothetical protein
MAEDATYSSEPRETQVPAEDLAVRRGALLARLAIERAGLLAQLLGLKDNALTEAPAIGSWTLKDVLAHIAAWDRWQHRAMKALVEGQNPDLSAQEDYHAANDEFVALWREQSLAEVLAELQVARADWEAWLVDLPAEDFFQRRTYAGEDWSFFGGQLEIMWRHDAMHAKEIAAWSMSGQWAGQTGPSSVLLAALNAARHELLACANLVPTSQRASSPVCGTWTLKDVLGHVADWEQVGVQGLRDMVAGKAPQVELIDDIEAWNQDHADLRRDQPWEKAWGDLHAVRNEMLETLAGTSQAVLEGSFLFPWVAQGTAYQWLTIFVGHDQEHAKDLWPEMSR